MLLDPQRLLPPPRIRGRLTGTWIANGVVFEQFGPAKPRHAITPPDARFPNYMYYRGGTLPFGKLTMSDTDLMLVDATPPIHSTSRRRDTTSSSWPGIPRTRPHTG